MSFLLNSNFFTEPEPSWLVKQDFEGFGYDNGEIWTPGGITVDPDYSISPILGSQSLRINLSGSSASTYFAFPSLLSNLFIRFRFRLDVLNTFETTNIVLLRSGSITTRCTVRITTSGLLSVIGSSGGAGNNSTETIPLNTPIYIWVDYQFISGSSYSSSAGWSYDNVKPAMVASGARTCVSVATSGSTVNRLYLGTSSFATVADFFYDEVRALGSVF